MTSGGLPAGFADAALVERARDAARAGFVAAPARDAATVALVRDGAGGLEVYLLRRVRGMAFAGGMHVFPGGAVDPADAAADGAGGPAWTGPSPAAWAAAFGTTEPLARALVCAAVRETFEESGVLLAGPAAQGPLADVAGPAWEERRTALEERGLTLSALLAGQGLVLRADLLRPLAHWITPEVEPRRYDTRFFLAELPAGQAARSAGGEADERRWVRPGEALELGLAMMPPTAAVLRDLAGHRDVASALAAPREVRPVLPKLVVGPGDEVALLLPGDDGYPG